MTEEERRRCILLGACNPDTQGLAASQSSAPAPCPASALAEMIEQEGISMHGDILAGLGRVLDRLGLPMTPTVTAEK